MNDAAAGGKMSEQARSAAKIEFHCDDAGLESGFYWAREQALSYAHDQGAAGPWYEAALPGRNAYCMRDVSHQAAGAHFLGLDRHNKNMLLRFEKSMAESRDYCCFWEITGDGAPAPEDYVSDRDFWYNLPANFDLLDACWRVYCLTGDEDYRNDPDLLSFYDRTVKEYIAVWDHDGDGIPDRAIPGSHRGIPSYDEQKGMENMCAAADLIAAQYRGLLSYIKLRGLTGAKAAAWNERAARLSSLLAERWYDRKNCRFYGAMDSSGQMFTALGSPHLLAYFDAVQDEAQRLALLDQIHTIGKSGIIVELLSHYPEIFFRHGQPERGVFWLRQLVDPALPRREYPRHPLPPSAHTLPAFWASRATPNPGRCGRTAGVFPSSAARVWKTVPFLAAILTSPVRSSPYRSAIGPALPYTGRGSGCRTARRRKALWVKIDTAGKKVRLADGAGRTSSLVLTVTACS